MFAGIHHLAFIAVDMDATVRFWRDLLGMPLVITAGGPSFKHYFFRVDERDTVAFFWWPEATAHEAKAPGVPTSAPRAFDHVAVGVRTQADLYALRDRIAAAGVELAGPVDHGLTLSIYLTDPNGIAVELAWQRVEVLGDLHFDSAPGPAALEGSAPRRERWPAHATGGLPAITRVDADAALVDVAAARGLVRPLDGE